MENVWIIGAGRFGSLAVNRLSGQHGDWKFLLVDPVKERLIRLKGTHITSNLTCGVPPDVTVEHADGIRFLYDHLTPRTRVSWIIPCLPVHLAWEWCALKLGPDRLVRTPLSSGVDDLLPNPFHGENGDVYASNADFLCPDNCLEPEELCTVTGHPRKKDMFKRLEGLVYQDFLPMVVRSRQLGPGIGGYRPEQLFSLLGKIKARKGRLLVCTACRCHGVMTGAQRG
jgi:hypothetical protein